MGALGLATSDAITNNAALALKAPILSPRFSVAAGINAIPAGDQTFVVAPTGVATGTISNTGPGTGIFTGTGTKFLNECRVGSTITVGAETRSVLYVPDDDTIWTVPFTDQITDSHFSIPTGFKWYTTSSGMLVAQHTTTNNSALGTPQAPFGAIFTYFPWITVDNGTVPLQHMDFRVGSWLTVTGTAEVLSTGIEFVKELSRTQAGVARGATLQVTMQGGPENAGDWTSPGVVAGVAARDMPACIRTIYHNRGNATQVFAETLCYDAIHNAANGTFTLAFGYRLKTMNSPGIVTAIGISAYHILATQKTYLALSQLENDFAAGNWGLWDNTGFASWHAGSLKVGGAFGCNGAAPQTPVALPAALPTDGSATAAQLATAYNALRTMLIANGIGSA